MRNETPSVGRPIVPLAETPSSEVAQKSHDPVSVSPNRSKTRAAGKRRATFSASAGGNGSPPVNTERKRGSANDCLAQSVRSSVGTAPRIVTSSSPPSACASFGVSRSRAPARKVSKATQMPKMKVSCSGTATTSSRVNASRRASLSSFQASPSWPTTTPFGCPVLPEVKTISAAPASSGRDGGGAAPMAESVPARTANRLPSRAISASAACAGVATWIGAATQPASQMPMNPARSSGSLAMNRTTGSFGAHPCARSAPASASAAAIISAAVRVCPPGAPVCEPKARRESTVSRPRWRPPVMAGIQRGSGCRARPAPPSALRPARCP